MVSETCDSDVLRVSRHDHLGIRVLLFRYELAWSDAGDWWGLCQLSGSPTESFEGGAWGVGCSSGLVI